MEIGSLFSSQISTGFELGMLVESLLAIQGKKPGSQQESFFWIQKETWSLILLGSLKGSEILSSKVEKQKPVYFLGTQTLFWRISEKLNPVLTEAKKDLTY